LDLIPFEDALLGLFYLRLVNWDVFAQADALVKDEEGETAHVFQLGCRGELDHLSVRGGFLLIGVHFDFARLSNLWIRQWLGKGLVGARDNLVQCEFK